VSDGADAHVVLVSSSLRPRRMHRAVRSGQLPRSIPPVSLRCIQPALGCECLEYDSVIRLAFGVELPLSLSIVVPGPVLPNAGPRPRHPVFPAVFPVVMDSSGADPARAHLSLVKGQAVAPGLEPASPAALLPRIAAGDERAVRECIERFGPLVWALTRRWSPDTRDLDDAVQEVFVDLWRSAARYDANRSTEAGWVAMITRRRLIDRLRRRQRAVELEPLPDDFDRAGDDQEPDLDRQTRIEQAESALQALPTTQRTMLELSLLHGRTHEEIARETGTPLGTVKSHIRRGLLKARTLVYPAQASPASPATDTAAPNNQESDR
jgi:RNA polymerase sigma factor (sigma-70 family)